LYHDQSFPVQCEDALICRSAAQLNLRAVASGPQSIRSQTITHRPSNIQRQPRNFPTIASIGLDPLHSHIIITSLHEVLAQVGLMVSMHAEACAADVSQIIALEVNGVVCLDMLQD
jgi:hypothetical protein